MEPLAWILGGIALGGALIVILFRRRGQPATPTGTAPPVRRESDAWRDRGRDTYVAGQGVLGDLTADAIAACASGGSGSLRRNWLRSSLDRATETSEAAAALSSEAVTPDGRVITDALARSLATLAEAASALIGDGNGVDAGRLAEAREDARTSLTRLHTIT